MTSRRPHLDRGRIAWALAAFAFLAAGGLDTVAALRHWQPCVGVDFDSVGCIEAQRDYHYYLPYAFDGLAWQPLESAAVLAALAFFATGMGWLGLVAGLPAPSGPVRRLWRIPALLPIGYGGGILLGLAGADEAAAQLHQMTSLGSLAVLVLCAIVAESVIRQRSLGPSTVAVLGLVAVNAYSFPAQYLSYIWWSAFYGSFDNPPFLGLERGLLVLVIGITLGLLAALARPAGSPAHRAGAALEGATHR